MSFIFENTFVYMFLILFLSLFISIFLEFSAFLLNNKAKEPPENDGEGSRGGPEEVDDDRSWEAHSYFFYFIFPFSISLKTWSRERKGIHT